MFYENGQWKSDPSWLFLVHRLEDYADHMISAVQEEVKKNRALYPSNDGIEDTEHFLLLCPSFAVPRRDLLAGLLALLRPYGYVNNSNEVLTHVLLYGDVNLPSNTIKSMLLLTLNFIHQTGRLD